MGHRLDAALARARLTRQPDTCTLHGVDNLHGEPADTRLVTILPVPRDGLHAAAAASAAAAEPALAHATAHADIQPIPGGGGATPFALERADLVLLVSPQQRRTVVSAVALKSLFGLTPAEARLAHALARGATVESYAQAAAISVATARTQLRATLAKTGEKRLQDLIRMLATLPAPH
ncbi:MAG: hypothetical protein GAK40_00466 [Burkholderia plantarii]|nr:MAG: hypothetical protein GAK40_00466 [Burkholderia plantarii]